MGWDHPPPASPPNIPGVYEDLHQGGEEEDDAGAAEGGPALLLLLHRVARLHLGVDEAHGEPEGALPLQPASDTAVSSPRRRGRAGTCCQPGNSRLDRFALQQGLVEQLVELLLVLRRVDHPLGQVPQPQPAPRVGEGGVHRLRHEAKHQQKRASTGWSRRQPPLTPWSRCQPPQKTQISRWRGCFPCALPLHPPPRSPRCPSPWRRALRTRRGWRRPR